jgi:hypothetical protein
MLPSSAILPLIVFMVLLLATALCVLAASGHFPAQHRGVALRSRAGTCILFGSLAGSALALASGVLLVRRVVPWYATVLGGGGMLLVAPLVLRPLPDHFVNGRGALVVLGGLSVFAAGLLAWLT